MAHAGGCGFDQRRFGGDLNRGAGLADSQTEVVARRLARIVGDVGLNSALKILGVYLDFDLAGWKLETTQWPEESVVARLA